MPRLALLLLIACISPAADPLHLLHVSFDPTRALYQELNRAFATDWKTGNNQEVVINQSHGGSGKQARAVVDGIQADVVSLALAHDIDAIVQHSHLLPANWRERLPHHSVPCYSTIVFLVRAGNPRGIRDWADLAQPGIGVITPNPKTSGGARWNYLAAWGWALRSPGGDETKARDFIARLYRNVVVLDSGARSASTTFLQRNMGDVLIAWESEARLALKESGDKTCELVLPSVSIKAETPVAVLETNTRRRGTTAAATAYLRFLYTPEAQRIIARHGFRPVLESVAKAEAATFPTLPLFTVDEICGSWDKAHSTHFADGGIFDQVCEQR